MMPDSIPKTLVDPETNEIYDVVNNLQRGPYLTVVKQDNRTWQEVKENSPAVKPG